jgi:multidrug resistance efflux pump
MPGDGQRVDSEPVSAGHPSAELDRLRALVGPSEASYEQLRAELAHARDAIRASEAQLGRLRGELTELRVDLARARQDQYQIRRIVLAPAIRVRDLLRRLGR